MARVSLLASFLKETSQGDLVRPHYRYVDEWNLIKHSDDSIPLDLLRHLGGISPWLPKVDGVSKSDHVPSGCVIDQVHMMSRHAERYPTVATGIRMLELYHRLKNANITLLGDLEFVNDWDFFAPYPAKHFEQLTTTGPYAGSLSAFKAGVDLRGRYMPLIEAALLQDRKIAIWAGLSERVIDSARYFANGFFGIDWQDVAALHIISETPDRGVDTLTPGRSCPKYATDSRGHSHGVEQLDTFRSSYLPETGRRLSKQIPEISFSVAELFTMQEMCAFELLLKGSSPWCTVFTNDEMESFEYARDVLHYYRAGPGNYFGPSLGWLWLNATASLLQQGPAAGPLFLSFNHDGDIIAMLAALDLFPQEPHLPVTHVNHTRTWRTSDVVPMGGRFILERFVCPAPVECWDNGPLYPNHVYCTPAKNETFIRVNINNGIVPIPGCADGPDESCSLEGFVKRIEQRGREIPSFADICGMPEGAPQTLTFLQQTQRREA